MIITLKRIYKRGAFTQGALQIQTENNVEYLVNKYFCDTLEPHVIDWKTEKKVAGKTAIPSGTYKVELGYSKTFKRMMPYLVGVPHFTGIMIHTGNTVANSRGCILVGKAQTVGVLKDSRVTFKTLYALIDEAIDYGENVWVKVI